MRARLPARNIPRSGGQRSSAGAAGLQTLETFDRRTSVEGSERSLEWGSEYYQSGESQHSH